MAQSPYQKGEPLTSFPSCLSCLEGLADAAAEMAAGDDPAAREKAVRVGRRALAEARGLGLTSPEVANRVARAIRAETGAADPYREFKLRELDNARHALERARPHLGHDLRALVGLAALGNSLDFFRDPDQAMAEVAERAQAGVEFFHDDVDRLEAALAAGPDLVLYLTDNTGEIHFDLPLFQEVQSRVGRAVLVVKGGPALNDLNREGLAIAGLAGSFEAVADTGSDGAGVEWDLASDEFLNLVERADLIIAKGMANFETICPRPTPCPVFCIFRAKCQPMQDYLHAPPHSFWALWREAGLSCRAPDS